MTCKTKRNWLVTLVVMAASAVFAEVGAADQYIVFGSSNTGDSSCSATDGNSGSCNFGVTFDRSDAQSVSSHFTWNINADASKFSSSSRSSSAEHVVPIQVFAPEGEFVKITVETRWAFRTDRKDDSSGSDADPGGSLELSGLSVGRTNSEFLYSSGEQLEIEHENPNATDQDFSYSRSRDYFALGLGDNQAIDIEWAFGWDGRVSSSSSELAIRMGADGGETTNCDSCVYPGDPSRDPDDHGHFVTVTVGPACGDGEIQTALGEVCDGGECCSDSCLALNESVCDDGDPCTVEACFLDGAARVCGGSTAAPAGTSCDDGIFCNGADSCESGSCTVHDGDPCPGADGDEDCSETCNEAEDSCSAADADGTSCRAGTGDPCDPGETCSGGVCPEDVVLPAGTVCRAGSGSACDPDEVCSGVPGEACPANEILPAGSACEDGDLCTDGDTCTPDGTCVATSVIECLDQDLCTRDSCDPSVGCIFDGSLDTEATCIAGFESSLLSIDESRSGREKVTARLAHGPALEAGDFGDPTVVDGTAYALCIHDDFGNLVASLDVDRAGESCARRDCWNVLGSEAPPPTDGYLFRYREATGEEDGVYLARLRAANEGRSFVRVRARNVESKGRTALPTGLAASLVDSAYATVRLLGDGGQCFTATVDRPKKQTPDVFVARGAGYCGDGEINVLDEECELDDLGGATCEDLGFAGGALVCGGTCLLDTAGCQ